MFLLQMIFNPAAPTEGGATSESGAPPLPLPACSANPPAAGDAPDLRGRSLPGAGVSAVLGYTSTA